MTITDGNGCFESFTFTVEQLTSTQSAQVAPWDIRLAPNPIVKGEFYRVAVSGSEASQLNYQIYQVNGQLISSGALRARGAAFEQELQAPETVGIYWLRLSDEKGAQRVLPFAVQ